MENGEPFYEFYGDPENFDEVLTWLEGGYLLEYSEKQKSEEEIGEEGIGEEGGAYYVDEEGREISLDEHEAEQAVDANNHK